MNPELLAKLQAIAIKYGKEMVSEMLVEVAFPALEQVVKDSATPIDDVVLAALEAPLKAKILEMLAAV
jgi:hypothetical protein